MHVCRLQPGSLLPVMNSKNPFQPSLKMDTSATPQQQRVSTAAVPTREPSTNEGARLHPPRVDYPVAIDGFNASSSSGAEVRPMFTPRKSAAASSNKLEMQSPPSEIVGKPGRDYVPESYAVAPSSGSMGRMLGDVVKLMWKRMISFWK